MAGFDEKTKKKALDMYCADVPVAEICDELGIKSRRSFYNWANDGLFTEGIPWDVYKEGVQRVALAKAKAAEMEQVGDEMEKFFETALKDVKAVYNIVVQKVMDGDSSVKYSVKDLSTLLTLAATLDNQGAEKIAWMEAVLAEIITIALEIMDEQTFALFKTKMIQLVGRKKSELDPINRNRVIPSRSSQPDNNSTPVAYEIVG